MGGLDGCSPEPKPSSSASYDGQNAVDDLIEGGDMGIATIGDEDGPHAGPVPLEDVGHGDPPSPNTVQLGCRAV